jgi:hypothetical protein
VLRLQVGKGAAGIDIGRVRREFSYRRETRNVRTADMAQFGKAFQPTILTHLWDLD